MSGCLAARRASAWCLCRDRWPDTGSNSTGTQRRAHSFKVSVWPLTDVDADAQHVCFWGKADIPDLLLTSANDPKRTLRFGSGVNPIWKRVQGMWVAMISTMRTARPTTGSPFSFSEAGTAPFDPMSSCFSLFGRLDPADPFIARERSNILPRLQRFYVGDQCLFQVRGQVMDHAA